MSAPPAVVTPERPHEPHLGRRHGAADQARGLHELAQGDNFANPAHGGWALLGDAIIGGISSERPYAASGWSGVLATTGLVEHEICHALGCEHPEDYDPPEPDTVGIMSHHLVLPRRWLQPGGSQDPQPNPFIRVTTDDPDPR
jgi:hypothetical protein